LRIRPDWPAAGRPLIRLDARPGQRALNPINCARHCSRAISVLYAQQKIAAVATRKQIIEQGRSETAQV
jgi:hypothetical protein